MAILTFHRMAERIVVGAQWSGLPLRAKILQAVIRNTAPTGINVRFLMLKITRKVERDTDIVTRIARRRTVQIIDFRRIIASDMEVAGRSQRIQELADLFQTVVQQHSHVGEAIVLEASV